MKKIAIVLVASLALFSCKKRGFVKTNGTHFEVDGKPYYFLGANFWAGMNLGSLAASGNRERLLRELDRMQQLGITNLRVVALTEGPDSEPYRIAPSNNDKGNLKEEYLVGLDFLLSEMGKRNMYAVMCMTNFWPWSGGMAQYLRWNNVLDSIHYPMDKTKAQDWDFYQKETAKFYSSQASMDMYQKALDQVIQRKNTVTGQPYTEDPTIMAWELCNEPRGVNNVKNYLAWIQKTAAHIKQLDKNHLVTVGSEGNTGSPDLSGVPFADTHADKNIDYTCAHIWIQNWNWYDPTKHDSTYASAKKKALDYLAWHVRESKKLGKPFVLEEFGIMKDKGCFDPKASNVNRDAYYATLFEQVYQYAKDSAAAAGVAFWAWGGEGRPREIQGWWKMGDDFIGDPPHEEQGWYSVYDTDTSTHTVIKKFATLFNNLGK
jgi:mannan endo-1,4-beta-mannosidase